MKKRPIPKCFIQQAMEAIGGKWRVMTVRALSNGRTSFSSLKRAMPSITERMLAAQLRELQLDGLIMRMVESEKPLRVFYELTPLGYTLVPIAMHLYEWGIAHGRTLIGNRSAGDQLTSGLQPASRV